MIQACPSITSPRTKPSSPDRQWVGSAIASLTAESFACAETPMHELSLPGLARVRLLLKDESAHPTGSLKHRLARSLFLYALCNGGISRGQVVIDASSGSTAISEAWFARRLGLPFIAVMPRATATAKIREIARLGGRCELLDPGEDATARARALASELDGCYLDQFGAAASATDWRGNNNIAQAILEQCRGLGSGDPDWIVCGAGTGGTSTTIGRYLRYAESPARLCIAEPAGAAFAEGWHGRDRTARARRSSCIEGIGRPQVEPCFNFELVDAVVEVPDAASIAAAWWLEGWTGKRYGGSSGTNVHAALKVACAMQRASLPGSVVMLLCDRGERYVDTVFDLGWLEGQGFALGPWLERLDRIAQVGTDVA